MTLSDWLYFSHPSFLLLIPLAVFLYIVKKHNSRATTQLSQFIDAKLLPYLQMSQKGSRLPNWVGLLVTCLFIIGIAGISWEKKPTRTFLSPQQTILILDQSLSMYATDIAPNRLTRMKQKVRDLLTHLKEGDIAITAYAGDAYVISPFSQDKKTLIHFLLALDPMIMPLYGSNPVAAFKTSLELIKNAQQQTHLILFTDDIKRSDIDKIKNLLVDYNVIISIVGIGTKEGATISLPTGQLLQSQQGVIKAILPEQQLKTLANSINANYYDSNLSDQDMMKIASINAKVDTYREANNDSLLWAEKGHWFALPFLLWLLYQFRSGIFTSLVLIINLSFSSESHATPLDWFATPDQQAQKYADEGDWQTAKSLFQNKEWQAAADYALGNYQDAGTMLEQLTDSTRSAEFFYNKGNSLALAGQLEPSIVAYEKAIELKDNFTEAEENLDYIKELLAKQQSDQNDSQSQAQQPDQQEPQSQSAQNSPSSSSDSGKQGSNDTKQKEQEQASEAELAQDEQAKQQDQANTPSPDIHRETELDQEDKIALNQWMRQIQDDPGGLLKRKLWYLHQEKRAENRYRQQDGLPIW
ncbi:VWA domain-containing protein [Marinomonas agarivorans]|nr:VWA domain-containing protein [Marinomonas agarivorans]